MCVKYPAVDQHPEEVHEFISLREDNRRLYVLNDENFRNAYFFMNSSNATEFMLIDFNLGVGDSYIAPFSIYGSVIGSGGSEFALYTVVEKSDILLNDTYRTLQRLRITNLDGNATNEKYDFCAYAIEGIGFINKDGPRWTNYDYPFCMPSNFAFMSMHEYNIEFLDFVDSSDGRALTKEMINNQISGVQEFEYGESNRDAKMYDLTGREIRNPLPGTIYVRDGRKVVAR